MTSTRAGMPPLTGSAAVHAERIARGVERRAERPEAGGKSTAELYAERILPGYRADERLRKGARLRELEARGIITAEDEQPDEYEDGEEFEDEADEEERPPTTAELYAARERERIEAGHAATLTAHHGIGQQSAPQVRHRYASRPPHRFANRMSNPNTPGPAA